MPHWLIFVLGLFARSKIPIKCNLHLYNEASKHLETSLSFEFGERSAAQNRRNWTWFICWHWWIRSKWPVLHWIIKIKVYVVLHTLRTRMLWTYCHRSCCKVPNYRRKDWKQSTVSVWNFIPWNGYLQQSPWTDTSGSIEIWFKIDIQ